MHFRRELFQKSDETFFQIGLNAFNFVFPFLIPFLELLYNPPMKAFLVN